MGAVGRIRRIATSIFPEIANDPDKTEYALKCPFHKSGSEQHPSFYLNVKTGLAFCHTCHRGWNFKTLLKELGWSKSLVDQITFELPHPEMRKAAKVPVDAVNDRVFPESYIDCFSTEVKPLLDVGFSRETLNRYTIRYNTKTDQIIFPVRDVLGNLVMKMVRNPPNRSPRYYYDFFSDEDRPKMSNYVWGLDQFYSIAFNGALPYLIIVEGAKKVMWLAQAGYRYTVSLSGSHISKVQRYLLSRLDPDMLIVLTDADSPGRAIAQQLGYLFGGKWNIKIPEYPSGVNAPDDLSKELLDELLSNAKTRRFIWRPISSYENTLTGSPRVKHPHLPKTDSI
jgi:5S rRNA maturation endonuclease (ribonuclease M5)